MAIKTVRKLEYFKTSGPLGMDDPKIVEYYSKIFTRGGFLAEMFAKRITNKILALKPDAQKIADIGTGPGFLPTMLAKLSGKKIYAVDISPNMLKKASEIANKYGVEINTVIADCKNLPFDDNFFDLVSSTNLIHMLDDIMPFLTELKRVVKPGGKAFITGFRRDVGIVIRKIYDFHSNVILKNKPLDGMSPVLDASFIKEELEDLLRKAGLNDYSVKEGRLTLETIVNF